MRTPSFIDERRPMSSVTRTSGMWRPFGRSKRNQHDSRIARIPRADQPRRHRVKKRNAALLTARRQDENEKRLTLARGHRPVALGDFLTDESPAVRRFPAAALRSDRASAIARVRFLRAALRRAESALVLPFTTTASLAVDAAIVALEAAREQLAALSEDIGEDEP
jgi:hypothetical protein